MALERSTSPWVSSYLKSSSTPGSSAEQLLICSTAYLMAPEMVRPCTWLILYVGGIIRIIYYYLVFY